MKNTPTNSPWFKPAAPVPPFEQITRWNERQRVRAFLSGAETAQNSTALIGKLFYSLQREHNTRAAKQLLRDAGASAFAVSKAQVFARSFGLVMEGRLTEEEYNNLNFAAGIRILRREGLITSREVLVEQKFMPRGMAVGFSLRRPEHREAKAFCAKLKVDMADFFHAAGLLFIHECATNKRLASLLRAYIEKK